MHTEYYSSTVSAFSSMCLCTHLHNPNHTRDIPHSVSPPSKAGNEYFVILLNEVEAAVPRDKGRDLFAILDQLHPNAFANSRIGLLGLHTTKGRRGENIRSDAHTYMQQQQDPLESLAAE